MNKTFKLKSLLLSMAVAGAATFTMAPVVAQAGVSANVGFVSTYVYRGVEQTSDGSASAGLDYEHESGFYAGVWGADVGSGEDGSGLEYDLYAGWAGQFGEISVDAGVVGYYYTGDFDTSYQEVAVSAGYGPITVGYAGGKWEDGRENGAAEITDGGDSDYTDMYITAEFAGVSLTYGEWDADTDLKDGALSRVELGYGLELAKGLDGSVTYIKSMPEDSSVKDEDYLVFGISKSFDIM